MFSIAASDGSLTPLGQEPTEATPREFEVALDKFVYAAGQDSDALAGYTIDAGGTLTPIDVYPVGAQPLWVTAVSLPAP
jgi:6-phosphogluconolactonase